MAAAEAILCRETKAIQFGEGTASLKEMEKMYRKRSLEAAAAISKTFEKQQILSKVEGDGEEESRNGEDDVKDDVKAWWFSVLGQEYSLTCSHVFIKHVLRNLR